MNFILNKLVKKAAKDPSKLIAKIPDEDFIPYVCHYDENTILTKNGELMQIIRISGLNKGSKLSELISLRETVREAIVDNVKENKFALWFSTIRRKKNITPKGEFKDFLSKKINDAWVNENHWHDQYINELYITIITEGLDTSVTNLNQFFRSLSYLATKSLHKKFLEEAHQKLNLVAQSILKETSDYGGKLLGFSEWDGALYSEPMRFFGKIVNLYEERYPLAANDISTDLASHKIAFGDRELEVVGYNNKNFAAMFSLKEYFEVSTELLDHVLQLPFEFIITQSFDFTLSKKSIEQREYQNYILQVSGDENFRQISGVANFIESNKEKSTDYGKQQITLMVISPNKQELEKDIGLLFEQFASLGFVLVREDLFSEHCFWAQLPANFRYLRRQIVINTSRIAGFAALHNFPSGSIAGNKWGAAVTTFRTVLNTPYFFNFHDGNFGHTLIVGPQGSGKTTLINFLLAQSKKFDGKIISFDFDNSSKCFIKSLGGSYFDISKTEGEESLRINPLLINSGEKKKFLINFFTSAVSFGKDPIPQNELESIPQAIDRIIADDVKNLISAVEIFNSPETALIYEKLKIWSSNKRLSQIFGAEAEDKNNWSNKVLAFNLEGTLERPSVLIPILTSLLEHIEENLDGSPSIIVLNEGLKIFDNSISSPNFAEFLDRMGQKNCVVILTVSDFETLSESDINDGLKDRLNTKIFLPNIQPHPCYKNILDLNEEEISIIEIMAADKERHFLMKHSGDSLIVNFDLSGDIELSAILSSDMITLTAMDEVLENTKSFDPKDWIPLLCEVLKAIEEERIIEEKERLRQEALARRRALMA
ncbi:MAG: hypothetical protein KGP29_02110 [Proteobacteria bacterium]|nr:hypothetical protein [Pseudomonadota bacterium]